MVSTFYNAFRPDKLLLDIGSGVAVSVVNHWQEAVSTIAILILRIGFEYLALRREKAKQRQKEKDSGNV